MDAQDGAGDASMLVVVAGEALELLPPLPTGESMLPQSPALRDEGVHDELEDAMAGRAQKMQKQKTCEPLPCMRCNSRPSRPSRMCNAYVKPSGPPSRQGQGSPKENSLARMT